MRNYIIISIDELQKVNFEEFSEDEETIIYIQENISKDVYTILKWQGPTPSCLNDIVYLGPYNESQVLTIIENDYFSEPDDGKHDS
jgi:hypothetical protein